MPKKYSPRELRDMCEAIDFVWRRAISAYLDEHHPRTGTSLDPQWDSEDDVWRFVGSADDDAVVVEWEYHYPGQTHADSWRVGPIRIADLEPYLRLAEFELRLQKN